MELFLQYLKGRRGEMVAGLVFCAIFAVTFALYRLPLRAVWYPAALCALVGLVLLILDFRRVREKHRRLGTIRSMTDAMAENLPQAEGIQEADYQEIIRLLRQEQTDFRTRTNRKYEDMVAYYTVWAHQIKTPIAAMGLTLQKEDSPLARRLTAELFRVEQYVEMVMAFLRLEGESSDYVIRPCDLDHILRQGVRKFAGEFISRRLKLVYQPVHTTVITDEKWLAFVIEQILSNALKYTPAGSITITLEPPKTLCIRDTGIGIDPADLPRIFDHGYTGCHGRRDKRASGIGLYLCKRICGNLGHTITAESVPDGGTAIRLDLSQRDLTVE